MNNEPQIYGYMVLVMVSIAFFNFSGVSITKYMSATTRKVLDTLRTMVIWICQMLLHQVIMIIIVMIIRSCSCRPARSGTCPRSRTGSGCSWAATCS